MELHIHLRIYKNDSIITIHIGPYPILSSIFSSSFFLILVNYFIFAAKKSLIIFVVGEEGEDTRVLLLL